MGILDIFRTEKKNAIQLNQTNNQPFIPWVWAGKKGEKPLGNFLLQTCLNLIWRGISNITFEANPKGKSLTPEAIVNFIDSNATLLVNQYIRLGYICVFYDKDHFYRIPQDGEIKMDGNGRIINKYAIVIYSPQYQTERLSLLKVCFPIIAEINKIAGSDSYLTDTLGVLCILSGQDIPLNPAAKKQFMENMEQNYGTANGKLPLMLANNDIKVTQIDPKIKELGFQEKIEVLYKYIVNLFGIPLQLLFDQTSTYNNIKEARISFYDTTIRDWAEILLKVAQGLLTASNEFIPKNALTYHFNNIPELERTLSSFCEERTAYLHYLLELKAAGIEEVDKQIQELYNESKDLLKEV